MYEVVYIIGLIVLFLLILTVFGFLIYKFKTDETIKKRYETLYVEKNNLILELQEREHRQNLYIEDLISKYNKQHNTDTKIIDKLLNDISFYQDVEKRKLMSEKEQNKRKKEINNNVKQTKELFKS